MDRSPGQIAYETYWGVTDDDPPQSWDDLDEDARMVWDDVAAAVLETAENRGM